LINTDRSSTEEISSPNWYDLPSTTALLTAGGDARILLSSHRQLSTDHQLSSGHQLSTDHQLSSGHQLITDHQLSDDFALNKYGCAPTPEPDLISFSSSTASTISEAAFSAANALRTKLATAIAQQPPALVYARELNRIKRELLTLCELDHMQHLDVVFAASGTDLHFITAQLCAISNAMPLLAIMPDALETGSGVPAALAASHFSSRTALGEQVGTGQPIAHTMAVDVAAVAIRLADGSLRATAAVDAEVEALVDEAASLGQHVLLIMVDTSKTGLISPSPACAIKLKQRYPRLLDILVDACQFRICAASLNAYLEHGFMVMLTGSKFISGPSFSAALFIPQPLASKLSSQPLPLGMRAYSSSIDWPERFSAATTLQHAANFGLLLRWHAALVELQQFKLVADKQIEDFCTRFCNTIQARLEADQHFAPLPLRPLNRSCLGLGEHWDSVPTIFSFVLLDDAGVAVSHQQTLKIYRWLQLRANDSNRPDIRTLDADIEVVHCQLGQPVIYSSHHDYELSALRLCLSARIIVEATKDMASAEKVIQRALSVLDNVVLLIKML